jgi:stage II sporulation SpoAA-like protein
MPVACHLRGELLTLVVVGITETAEIEQAMADAVSQRVPGAHLRLLWDARRAAMLLTADDVARRLGMVATLAHSGIVVRSALLMDGTHQATALGLFRKELPKALPLPVQVFTDKGEAVAWLESFDPGAADPIE